MSKLTKSSNGKTCIRCGAPDAFSAHYNSPRQHLYGKGRSIKCNDIATAEFCHNCDDVFTEGSYSKFRDQEGWRDENDRSEWFQHWIMMTNIRRMDDGDLHE
jgi:hypothetical protein